MRDRACRLAPTLLLAAVGCGPAFSSSISDLDASFDSAPRDVVAPPNETAPEPASDASTDGSEREAEAPPVANGLLLWLRADVGVTESNGAVTTWADQSGNHLDARQNDPLTQPVWAEMGLSGRPAVIFNAEDFLSLTDGFSDFSNGISLFAIAAITGTGPCVDILHLSNGSEIDDIALGRHDGRVLYEVFDGVLHGEDFPLGSVQLISVVHDAARNVTMRLDGTSASTTTFDLPRTGTRLSNVIGRSLYVGCGSVHGAVGEIMIYRRALDDSERTRVETQLQSRWGCCR